MTDNIFSIQTNIAGMIRTIKNQTDEKIEKKQEQHQQR